MQKKLNIDLAGQQFSLETGLLAPQANGAVVGAIGETVVLATAVMGKEPRTGINFFPLMVDYEEKLYAAGKIKGSRFIKREGRPTDEAVLSGRLIDRGLRPLFPEGMRNDVQVMLSIFSVDEVNDPDIVGMNAASAALMISDIPFEGPLAGCRIGRIDGQLIINPTYEQRKKGDLDIVVSGTRDHIMMVEAGASIVPEDVIMQAIRLAQTEIQKIVDMQLRFAAEVGAKTKAQVKIYKPAEAIAEKVEQYAEKKLEEVLYVPYKSERDIAYDALEKQMLVDFEAENLRVEGSDSFDEAKQQAKDAFYKLAKSIVRRNILGTGKRLDGRPLDQTREVSVQVGLLPRTHGSALFNRGETQALTSVTLGSPGDAQILDGMEDFEETEKRYMHHYNMPGFSVGEVAPVRGAGRREIGHGALAERALMPVLPDAEKFPYTLRLVSEVLSSNGSTSMASTCGSSLSLMDAGVPIKAQVGGVAMGLVLDPENSEYKVLTDIQGSEDFFGDMDFKVAGPAEGITALQLDVKTRGLTAEILEQALAQANRGRLHIIEVMNKAISQPRAEMSKHAPRIESFRIDPKKIRDVIGTGGKVINEIIEKTGVKIDIEDDGLVAVTSKDPEGMRRAVEWIQNIVREVEAGQKYEGKVTRIMDFGAFVEVSPGKEGLVHISEMAPYHVNKVEDVVKIGDTVKVTVKEIDSLGRINLTMLAEGEKRAPREDSFNGAGGPRRPNHGGPRPPHRRPGGGNHGGFRGR